jgi:hypothetical protein
MYFETLSLSEGNYSIISSAAVHSLNKIGYALSGSIPGTAVASL